MTRIWLIDESSRKHIDFPQSADMIAVTEIDAYQMLSLVTGWSAELCHVEASEQPYIRKYAVRRSTGTILAIIDPADPTKRDGKTVGYVTRALFNLYHEIE